MEVIDACHTGQAAVSPEVLCKQLPCKTTYIFFVAKSLGITPLLFLTAGYEKGQQHDATELLLLSRLPTRSSFCKHLGPILCAWTTHMELIPTISL